jgi:predicted CxxxxCH...CXXCH cytochrome family protein
MIRSTSLLAVACAALALSACDQARPLADADADGGLSACTGCHGDATRESDPLVRAAPPASTLGGDGGAHLAHLSGDSFRAPLACAECHDVPALVDHADGVVDVPMAGLAVADGASPSWDSASGTCSSVYCHGATLGGGPAQAPAWSSTAGLGCSSCHGAPPPAPHAASTSCGGCHTGYTQSSVNAATHLDGTVEVSGGHASGWSDPTQHGYEVNRSGLASCRTCHETDLTGGSSGVSCNSCHGGTAWQTSCTFCHGDTSTGHASPPVDTQGRSSATNVSVGVHASHVGTTMATPIACTECHPSRAGSNVVTDALHVDGNGVAEVSFGTLARTGSAPATYDRVSGTSATCASTYCHGRFTGGANSGSGATVSWTSTSQVTCASCHGDPPGTGRHSRHNNYACSECHGHGGSGAPHANGVKNVALVSGTPFNGTSCGTFSCHGKNHDSGETWR